MTEYYDIHCHLLPGMDDGCKNPDETIRLLQEQKKQGCKGIVATSHYYPRESIESFLKRRQECYDNYRREAEATGEFDKLPPIEFGAEVAYHSGLVQDEDFEKLCMGKSRYLLLEMPFEPWTPAVMRDVRSISSVWGITPVIAHIERFLSFAGKNYLEEMLYDMDVIIQVNAGNFASFSKRHTVLKLIKKDLVQAFGTDSHNMTSRKPNMELAINGMKKARLQGKLEKILTMNEILFKTAADGKRRVL